MGVGGASIGDHCVLPCMETQRATIATTATGAVGSLDIVNRQDAIVSYSEYGNPNPNVQVRRGMQSFLKVTDSVCMLVLKMLMV